MQTRFTKSKLTKYEIKQILPWLWLGLWLIIYIVFMCRHIDMLINSDDSAEMALAHFLRGRHELISREWFYTTEPRIINSQLVFEILFFLFKDWHTVRILGSVICVLAMLGSYYFFCKSYGCEKFYPLTAAFLIIPFSNNYFVFTLKGLYYIVYLCWIFLILGLSVRLLSLPGHIAQPSSLNGSGDITSQDSTTDTITSSRKPTIILTIFLCAASFIASLPGLRMILALVLPYMCALAILLLTGRITIHDRSHMLVGSSIVGGSILGLGVNMVILSRAVHVRAMEEGLKWADFKFSRLEVFITDFMTSCGYDDGDVFAPATIRNAGAILLMISVIIALILCLRAHIRSSVDDATATPDDTLCVAQADGTDSLLLTVFIISDILLFAALYAFTNMKIFPYHNLPIIGLGGMIIAMWLHNYDNDSIESTRLRSLILAAFLASLTILGLYHYAQYASVDDTADLREIRDLLTEKGYTEGYTTYWSANALEELSDGQIRVICISDEIIPYLDIRDTAVIYNMSQPTDSAYYEPKGPIFILLTCSELARRTIGRVLSEEDADAMVGDYCLYLYESYDAMNRAIQYNGVELVDLMESESGEYSDGVISCESGTMIYGPYIPIPAGEHTIYIEGDNLDLAAVTVTQKQGTEEVPCTVDQTADHISIELDTNDKLSAVSVRLLNRGKDELVVKSIRAD